MKKLIIAIFLVLFSLQAEAGLKVTQKQLTISGSPISSYAIGSGLTVTSDSVYQTGNVGYGSMLLLVSGSVDASFQVSRDGSNWYTPYTTDGITLSAAGAIATAVSADRWIILPIKMAPYVRFIFSANSSSTISANYQWQLQEN